MDRTRMQSIDAILEKTFQDVRFEFHDLDGLHWTPEQLKEANAYSARHCQRTDPSVVSLAMRGLPSAFRHGTDPERSNHVVAVPVSERTSTQAGLQWKWDAKSQPSWSSRPNSGLDKATRQTACRDVTNSLHATTTRSLPDENRLPKKTFTRGLRRSATFTHLDFSRPERSIAKADMYFRDADGWYRIHREEVDLDSPVSETSSGSISSRRFTFPFAFSPPSSGASSNEGNTNDDRLSVEMDNEGALARVIIGGDLDGLAIRDIDDELGLSLSYERPVTPVPGQQSPLKDKRKRKLQLLEPTDEDDEDEDGLDEAQDISYYEDDEKEDDLPTPKPYSSTVVDTLQSEMEDEAFEDVTDGFAFSETPESFRIRRNGDAMDAIGA
uniref:Uncharacterized protein n=1 Tax=Moniliophthora roreri TaxID=221103 RepID=A0A0W0EYU1_MONRR